ncbi:pantoate--beta-alanine ligase [Helicobacter enhydrae]|uniref:Pantothenate synthetase n=1 Tax=Helicobacter enhydrae TaxID=222136 RepID=A0A1B1U5G2_9HELI|nr:pantoate--beta-alanine ligase [Helicobacter enhydrae]ANV97996.1 pantoate--beta-alanine ligase [Helicobacter enhydrae]
MKILKTINDLLIWRQALQNTSVGFVPTMGALHQGHLSLLQQAKTQNQHTLLSIFVNPTQFGANEDLSRYPRTLEQDLEMAQSLGIDAVFIPEISTMYASNDEITLNPPKQMGYVFEGFHRLGHFDGVLQIVLKLFNLVRPTRSYFGQKDAQQLLLIEKMIKDLFLDIEIVRCPIVRDSDGLALSSRNVYLSKQERTLAQAIPQTLQHIQALIQQGITDTQTLKTQALARLTNLEVQYLAFCNHSLEEISHIIPNQTIVLLTCKVGNTRLLDNLWL